MCEYISKTCAICLEYYDTQYAYERLTCGHVFHSSCIKRWEQCSKNTCPLCRSVFVINDDTTTDDNSTTLFQTLFRCLLDVILRSWCCVHVYIYHIIIIQTLEPICILMPLCGYIGMKYNICLCLSLYIFCIFTLIILELPIGAIVLGNSIILVYMLAGTTKFLLTYVFKYE